ncbi:MAG: MCE family protein [Kiritimatiellaeota bacterium]|nr:MCE family protein [Kiritimatiellota bacterium]
MIEAHKFKLGVFILTGFTLVVVALFLLGLSNALKPKVNFTTYFNESVQGLEPGSPVKFRGVTIGRVTRIAIRPKDNFIRVDMQAIPSSIEPSMHGAKPIDFFKNIDDEVTKGLRCRLELKGITGMKYVEMDYTDSKKFPLLRVLLPPGIKYVPSIPSLMSGLRVNLSTSLAKISNIDFEKMSAELSKLLAQANKILSDPKLTEMIAKAESLTSNFEKFSNNLTSTLTKKRLKSMMNEVRKTAENINKLSITAEKELKDSNFPDTTAAVRDVGKELSESFSKLNETLDSIQELVDSISDDPSSLVRGKQAKKEF